ncbi:MAG: ABC transporter ATP-binding protein [Gemmataceae bacterium]|nr:ABC transporter ATP-binding protein [Gemmataceae bacterium]MDW8263697.1 ABC transporter ATP-binding protein [Gemmataceae bacterium]
MLEIESLVVAAGNFRLRDVSLMVAPGECHAVLGPSGSGKTTLLEAVLGLLTPEKGCIRLAGTDLTRLPIEQRGLGYVPQQLGLFPHLSVRDNLAYSARARGIPQAKFQPLLKQLVEAAGLGNLLDRFPATLSGGERQRVGLVRALVSQPRLVLLDEPFAALNENLRRELWWLLREWQRERQLTILLVTHDLAEAYFLAEQVTVLLDGRVAQQGHKAEVYAYPATAEVARFLGVETLQPGRVVSVRDGLATVEVGSVQLTALAPQDLGEDVLVSIRGEDVILQSARGAPTSARNVLVARVVGIRPATPLWCVELDAGFPLLALVTRPAAEEIGLSPGAVVVACIKAPSVHLIGRSAPPRSLALGSASSLSPVPAARDSAARR